MIGRDDKRLSCKRKLKCNGVDFTEVPNFKKCWGSRACANSVHQTVFSLPVRAVGRGNEG